MIRKSMITAAALVLVAGCSGTGSRHSSHSYSSSSWGNYKCVAVGSKGGYSSIGWAADKSLARDNALSKCRARSGKSGGSCHITQCHND